MVIETKSVEKPYAREAINVTYNTKKLIANPKRKVPDMFLIWPVYLAFSGAVMAWLISFLLRRRDLLSAVLVGGLAIIIFFAVFFYTNCLKARNKLLSRKAHITVAFTAEGVEYDDHEQRKLMAYWSAVQAVKVCKHGVYLIPKDIGVPLMGFPIEHLGRIKDFMENNRPDVEFVN